MNKDLKRTHILQHVPFENIGSIATWLDKTGTTVTYTRFFEDARLPDLAGLSLIIIMGGPMSVNDESALPWLRLEKEFIRDAVNSGVSVLGVCLGAQLIASALGARVYRNPHKEIGWFPVEAVAGGKDIFIFPKKFSAFHWHGETFDLPGGAALLARSQACKNQAFQIGRKVIGLQFHLEVTRESVRSILGNCGTELARAGRYVQTASELNRVNNAAYARINNIMDSMLSYVTQTPD